MEQEKLQEIDKLVNSAIFEMNTHRSFVNARIYLDKALDLCTISSYTATRYSIEYIQIINLFLSRIGFITNNERETSKVRKQYLQLIGYIAERFKNNALLLINHVDDENEAIMVNAQLCGIYNKAIEFYNVFLNAVVNNGGILGSFAYGVKVANVGDFRPYIKTIGRYAAYVLGRYNIDNPQIKANISVFNGKHF